VYHRVSGSESDRGRRFLKCIAQSRDNGKHCRIKSRECCDLNINLIKRWVWIVFEQVKPKDTEIGVCWFSAKHAVLRKSKDWLARNQDNVSWVESDAQCNKKWENSRIHRIHHFNHCIKLFAPCGPLIGNKKYSYSYTISCSCSFWGHTK
jgi:hypothetical protein